MLRIIVKQVVYVKLKI